MNKPLLLTSISLLMATAAATTSPLRAAQQATYHLSVVIPEIPGVNVPPFTDERALQRYRYFREKYHGEILREEVVRDGRRVILESIVVK